jgi:DNA-binding MarR family transcriptional regulator
MERIASAVVEEEPFLLEGFLPYQLSVAANRISRLFARRYSREFGLSIAEWRVMAVVGRFGAITASVVAERAEMDKVKVSRAASGLLARGLLAQGPDPADGRARRLRLTARGREVHRAIVARARTLAGDLAAGMDAAELGALQDALGRLSAHARELEAAEAGDEPPAPPEP